MSPGGDMSQPRRIEASILRAALFPDAWHEALSEIAAACGVSSSYLIAQDRTHRGTTASAVSGFDPAVLDAFARHFQFLNPMREGWSKLASGTLCSHHSLVAQETWARSEFVNDWVLPNGMTGATGIVLSQHLGRVYLIGIQTEGERSEIAGAGVFSRYGRLMCHALQVNLAMFGQRIDALSLRHSLDPATAAILVLGRSGVPVWANARAEALLVTGAHVRVSANGRLELSDPDLSAQVAASLARPRPSQRGTTTAGGSRLTADLIPVDEALAGELVAEPLRRALSPWLVLVLSPPRTPEAPDPLIVRFGLTAAEAAVARALAEGMTPAEIAEARGASAHTVRNQIKASLWKTGSRRQTELAALVLRSSRD
jgi:DNA-binding CsgD family transcriptional regulator